MGNEDAVRRRAKLASLPLRVQTDVALLKRMRDDPVFFCAHVLGVDLWGKQQEIAEGVRDHRKVSVRSGNTVGKTFIAACVILWFLVTHPGSKVLSTATTKDHVKLRLWRQIRSLYRNAKRPIGGQLDDLSLKMDGDGWEAFGLSTKNPDAFKGAHEEHILIVFDEAQGIERQIWDAAETMMGSPGARWLVIANPTYTTGEFWESQRKPHEWRTIAISCLDHPNMAAERAGLPIPYPKAVTLRWVEERRVSWGEDSPLYITAVTGNFPEEGEGTLIPLGFLERCADGIEEFEADGRQMGVDIARFGSDFNVATLVVDRTVVDVRRWNGLDTMATTGKVIALMAEWSVPAENVHLDVIGVGGGVVDRLREQGYLVDAVNFGEGPLEDWTGTVGIDMMFLNRRAELYWVARRLLQQRGLCVPRRFGECWAELVQPTYEFDSAGRVKLEPKDKIKERTGRSPDHADSLVIALSRSANVRGAWVLR